MTPEDKVEIKDFIHDALSGYIARVEAQNEITNVKLTNIDAHLLKQNGRLGKAEEAIAMALQERGANRQKQEDYFKQIDGLDDRVKDIENKTLTHAMLCPNIPAIRALQDEALTTKSVKKFMFIMLTTGIAIGSLVVAVIKLATG